MSTIPLCKDCAFFKVSDNSRHPMCGHPEAAFSPVDGTPITKCAEARHARNGEKFCGQVGVRFQQSQPMLVKPELMASAAIVVLPCGSVILSAGPGYGKQALALPLSRLLMCREVVNEWSFSKPLTKGALHITNESLFQGGAA